MTATDPVHELVNAVYLSDSRRLLAALIRLGRLLVELLPEPDTRGLLALMLLHDSRRAGRTLPPADAGNSYERAFALRRQEPQQRFLEQRLAELPR